MQESHQRARRACGWPMIDLGKHTRVRLWSHIVTPNLARSLLWHACHDECEGARPSTGPNVARLGNRCVVLSSLPDRPPNDQWHVGLANQRGLAVTTLRY